ncbi:MAG TPA: response regulator [Candidatus Angelobacter sp.]|jgi:ActR/RegA family two-component response regulator|nr:response regulator [Candidatus Angelobacter sp.]
MTKKRLLFVDDETNIRLTLPAILEREGFAVTVASSVAEALASIQRSTFDILLSDLNIGQPGDGFTVVSAMRRIQPQATTFILTGYPDFESALVAIRNQVDDYIVKPADVAKLVQALKTKSDEPRRPERAMPSKRVSVMLREGTEQLVERWLMRVRENAELSKIAMHQRERIDHVPNLIEEIADRIESYPHDVSDSVIEAAGAHGRQRSRHGYTIPMLLVESALLQKTITELLQENLLTIDISTLIPDVHLVAEVINRTAELSVRAFLELTPETEAA